MRARIALLLAAAALVLSAWFLPPGSASAAQPRAGAAELIAAVNGLRLAQGLAPLSQHPILMQTAQGQADALLATEGAVGHARPNGITFTQQLLLLGYPLWGDLSLGGYRSENFIFGYQLSAYDAIEAWQGDDPHLQTMISADRNDIGAGVAMAPDGTVYYVIDTALSTPDRLPQSDAALYLPGAGSGTPDASMAMNQYIIPITVSTARPDGNVYHTVRYGQTLWGIAIQYGTKIDEIRRLNHLGSDNTVYPDQLLLVKQGATQPAPAAAAMELPTALLAMTEAAPSAPIALRASAPAPEAGTPLVAQPAPSGRGPSLSFWIAVVLFVLIAGGASAVWFIREPGQ